MRADVRDITALRTAADQVEQQFGRIDVSCRVDKRFEIARRA
jgi:hypothetical protein